MCGQVLPKLTQSIDYFEIHFLWFQWKWFETEIHKKCCQQKWMQIIIRKNISKIIRLMTFRIKIGNNFVMKIRRLMTFGKSLTEILSPKIMLIKSKFSLIKLLQSRFNAKIIKQTISWLKLSLLMLLIWVLVWICKD